MRIVLVTFLAVFVIGAPAAFAAADRTLDCSSPNGTSTAVLDFKHGVAFWSTKDQKTGLSSQSTLKLSGENGQYSLDTGHSSGRYDEATGALTWSYRDRVIASAACRERNLRL